MLQFFPTDTHGPLVALGDAHLVLAAFHILARVFGGVDACEHKRTRAEMQICQSDWDIHVLALNLYVSRQTDILATLRRHALQMDGDYIETENLPFFSYILCTDDHNATE